MVAAIFFFVGASISRNGLKGYVVSLISDMKCQEATRSVMKQQEASKKYFNDLLISQ